MAVAQHTIVSLPSINELFPEHMMQSLYTSHRDSPRGSHTPTPESPQHTEYPHSSATPHAGRPPMQVITAGHRDLSPHPSPWQPAHQYQYQSGHLSDSHGMYQTPIHPPIDGISASQSHEHPYNPRRQNPIPAHFNTATQQTYSPCVERGNDSPLQKPPIFCAPPHDSPTMCSMHGPPAADYIRGYQHPARYDSNAYISSSSTSAHGEPTSRVSQTHVLSAPPYDEKKHCCPHCNKRFNRPSSLNIHVNTHTGAKPFLCPHPGCQRRFNVNSNMRRHYRNHVSSNRRRDAVARLLEPTSAIPPTPPLSGSPTDTPVSHFSGSLPSSSDTSTPSPSRSPSPLPSCRPRSEEDGDWFLDDTYRYASSRTGSDFSRSTVMSYYEQHDTRNAGVGPSCAVSRQRSQSSPIPPSPYRHIYHPTSGRVQPMRPRSSSCADPGCDCQPEASAVSTTLRPAFSAMSMRADGPH